MMVRQESVHCMRAWRREALLVVIIVFSASAAHAERHHDGLEKEAELMALRRALAANASSSAMAMCVSQLLAILKPVAASNSSLQTDEAIKDALIQELTGTEACASAFAAPSADETVVISTLRFPAWFNGAVTTWLKDQLQSNPQVVALLQDAIIDVPDTLPALGSFSAGSMRDYLTVQQNQYSVVSMDVSGFPAWSVWAMLQTADPFVIPENVCVNDTEPRGLIHPRVYLTMFYRAEALAALEAGGYVPSAAPPDDWEQLIALLEGHRLANSSRSSSSSSSSNSSSSSSSGGGGSNRSSLPKYGLCISTHPACGLLGDFWAALAASVLQTQGTEQGYLYDLSTGSPSSAIPLANSTGWLYATELLRRVMVFNAPEPFDLTTNNRTTDGEVECTDVSGHFKSGDCMITFDWDIMLGVMNTTQLRPPAAQLLVAPLPGSRTVMDRRAGSSTSGQLVPCDWELCGVSANHDLLYLGLQQAPPPSSAVAAASAQPELARTRAAVAAAAQALEPQAPVSVLTASTGSLPTHCDPSVTAAVESAAVQQVLSAAGVQQPAAGALVNRAPYSACMMSANKYQSTDAGLTLSSRTFATVGAIITSLMDAQYVRRNVATVMARAALGYPVATTGVMLTTTAYGSMSTSNSSSSGVSSGASNSASSNSNDTLTAANGTAASGNSVAAAGSAAADTGMLLYLRMRWWTALREPFNVSGFEGTGISDDAIQSCAQAVWHGLHAPNAAPEAASPAPVNFIKWGLASAANMLILPINTSTAAANASAALQEVMYMVNEAFTERATRTMYESSIDYQAQSKAPSKQGAAGPGSKAISNEALAGLLVGLIAAVILGIVVVVVVALRLRRRNRDLLGRVRAPRVGVDTTLLISDIQNSTRLWEELSVTTMDAALKMHHATFCKLIPAHDGYESATEGDSFIIAFPSPASALAFATACQLALLHQDWPQELLQHPDGAVVAVEARGGREGTGGFRHSCRSPAKSMRNLRGDSPPQSWQPLSAAISLWDRLSGRAKQRQAVGPSRGLAAGDSELRFSGAALHTGTSAGGLVVSPEPHLAQLHLDSGGTDACGRALTDEGPSSCGVRSPDAGGETGENHVPQLTTGAQLTAGSPQHIQPQLPPVLSKLSEGGSGAAGSEQEQQDGSINSALHHEPGDHAGQVQATPVGSDVEPFSTTSYSTLAAVSGITAATASIGTTWGRVLAMMYPLESVTSSAGTGSSGPATGGLGGAVTPLRRLIQTAYSHSGALGHGNSAKITCFRGPRVRMGMHCGLDDGRHVVWNRVNSTFQYTGPFAETAKLVSDAAHGGLVTLSAAAFARYRNCTSAASGAAEHVPRKAHGIVIAYAGHHILSDKPPTALPASLKGGEVAASSNVFVEHVMLELHDGGDGACVAATQAAEAISGQVALFLAVPASLLCRLAYTPPLRTLRQVQLGSLAAPTGSVTIAFMKVVGASTLLTELPGPASRALDQFQRLACGLLMGAEETTEQGAALDFRGRSGGYLVEGGDGLVLAAFGSPLAAVEWALDTVEALRELVWEEELLAHELCEEVLTVSPGAVTNAATMYAAASTLAPHAASFHSTRGGRAPSPSPLGPADPRLGALAPAFTPAPVSASPPQLSWLHQSHLNPQLAGTDALALFRAGSTRVVAAAERRTTERGLRVKVGLDVGPVTYSLTESSGRLSYRGRVMNRAARIAGTASPGQVLCSGAVWAACEAGMAAVPLPGSSQQLVGVSLGKVALKGITSPVEIFQCQHEGC